MGVLDISPHTRETIPDRRDGAVRGKNAQCERFVAKVIPNVYLHCFCEDEGIVGHRVGQGLRNENYVFLGLPKLWRTW